MPFSPDFAVNLTTVGFGLFEGWSSPSINLLTSPDTPLPSGQISIEQASWVASVQVSLHRCTCTYALLCAYFSYYYILIAVHWLFIWEYYFRIHYKSVRTKNTSDSDRLPVGRKY